MPELSKGKEEDVFMVPNVPLIAAFAKTEDANVFKKNAFHAIVGSSGAKQFHMKTVNEFLFGYNDSFIGMVPDLEAKQAGLISGRRGSMICVYSRRNSSKIHFQVSRLTT